MVEKIIAAVVLALASWLEKRIEKSKKAVVADSDRERLARAGDKLERWLRENGARERGQSDESRT